MSDTPTNQESTPEPAKTPLQRLKERQAQNRKNLAAKGTGSAPAIQTGDAAPSGPISQKKMRSSASKQGG